MYGGYFETKEAAEEYRVKHEHKAMVVEFITSRQKWALVFPLKAIIQTDLLGERSDYDQG